MFATSIEDILNPAKLESLKNLPISFAVGTSSQVEGRITEAKVEGGLLTLAVLSSTNQNVELMFPLASLRMLRSDRVGETKLLANADDEQVLSIG